MTEPFVGEIRIFAGNFAPLNWAFCAGQTMSISENEVLFQLLGTTYGGDGVNTFNLPDLRGRVPVHMGSANFGGTYVQGQVAGVESVTLQLTQIPAHSHPVIASTATTPNLPSPANNFLAANTTLSIYSTAAANQPLNNQTLSNTGGSQPHENRQPYLGISFIIALFGVFPSQN